MNDQIFNIDRVRHEAISAADANKSPSDCPYTYGSPACCLWMLEFVKQTNRLAARERAARNIDPEAA